MRILIVHCLLYISAGLAAQNTMGVTVFNSGSLDGYTFFSPFSGTKAYLVDNCGRLINQWDRGTRPGLSVYFLENGLMLRTFKPPLEGPFTSASNAGGLELVDWDNNTIWSYEINSPTELSHHDVIIKPDGNLLVLTWELVFTDELVALGRNPDQIAPQGFMWSERIVELQPVGNDSAAIVWEWRIKDHYIQDFDSAKAGYGVVENHPELFDINLPDINSSNSNASRDWNHFNAIDYHPELEQVLISTRNSDEIWILDQSTTTAEAVTHSGGRYGKGGDILYRWGNASAYRRAPVSAQKLFGQHGVQWIDQGLADEGKIIIFNNGNGRPGPDFSTAEILQPPQDSTGGYPVPDNAPFGPEEAMVIYGNKNGEDFYSPFLSNAQRLPNGNTLVNAGSPGLVLEIDSNRQIVWEYIIPLNGDFPGTQGQNIFNNGVFRVYKYPADYPGFDGLDLTPGATIENGTDPAECQLGTSVRDLPAHSIEVWYQAASHRLILNTGEDAVPLLIFDMAGRAVSAGTARYGEFQLPELHAGVYLVHGQPGSSRWFTSRIMVF